MNHRFPPCTATSKRELAKELEERESIIIAAVQAGEYQVDWKTLTIEEGSHAVELHVFADALKIDGVRVNASAQTCQHIADLIGACLLTPKIADQVWLQRETTLSPRTQSINATTPGMIKHSEAVEEQLEGQTGLLDTIGKLWVLDEDILRNQRLPQQAMNYGWHFAPGRKWGGINGNPTASLIKDPETRQYVHMIQSRGWHHDIHHVDYCLAPSTRVLTADLCWVDIASLVEGDQLIGFDEKLSRPHLRRATVQKVTLLEQPCFEVETSRATVVASAAHRWPVKGAARATNRGVANGKAWSNTRRCMGWVATEDLKPGQQIPYLCDPWEQDTSWDGAWMAGIIDGEGWLSGTTFGVAQEEIHAEVLNIRNAGVRPVVGIQTSTGTFIAEGLLSHNSQIVRLVARDCTLDGKHADLADVLKGDLAYLVSHNGPLSFSRHPFVEHEHVGMTIFGDA